MDYGQPTKADENSLDQAFFTAGAGNESVDINDVEPENNLDLTNREIAWDILPPNISNSSKTPDASNNSDPHKEPKTPHRGIGNKAFKAFSPNTKDAQSSDISSGTLESSDLPFIPKPEDPNPSPDLNLPEFPVPKNSENIQPSPELGKAEKLDEDFLEKNIKNLQPSSSESNSPSDQQVAEKAITAFNPEDIRTTDKLDHKTMEAVKTVTDEFNQTGNAEVFYGTIRDMMQKNLENSYDRKLAA